MNMGYTNRKNPLFSACGLNCGLCPRYHTEGTSRCPGCAGEGFSLKHPSCGVLSCCLRREIEYCFLCDEYACAKYEVADMLDSFISHKNQLHDLAKAKDIGLGAYETELNKKVELLKNLLDHYDDGRRKSFYCTAVNLLSLDDIETVRERLDSGTKADDPLKIRAAAAVRLFDEIASSKNISLKLRKKVK